MELNPNLPGDGLTKILHKSAYLDGHILEVGKYTVHSTAHTSVLCNVCVCIAVMYI